MKILCFIDSLGAGGAQRQLVELAKGFHDRGYEVSFLTYHEINFFKPELDAIGIPVKTIVEPNYLKRMIKIRKAIRAAHPDAVLAFLEAAAFMATFAGFPRRKWKLIVGERSANPKILTSPKLRFYRFYHLFSDYVVANSHANMDLVRKANPFLPDRKCKVIYNIPSQPQTPVKASSPRQDGKTRIVVAASYRPVKNLDGLIEAVRLLSPEDQSKLEIHWYGSINDQTYYDTCVQNIKKYQLDSIFHLHPPTQNIHQKYADADFVGLFSHHEGFPNTICEAMVMGKPVIATNVSDIPLIIEEGKNGYLCDSKINNSIKIAINKGITCETSKFDNMTKYNKELIETVFDKKEILKTFEELLT